MRSAGTKQGLLCLVVASLLVMSGCDSEKRQPTRAIDRSVPAFGDTYIESSIGEPNTLLPVLASDSASSSINAMVYSSMIRYDKDFNWEGELAESWEVSADGLTMTFHLRRDVTWHDGTPFTSADVDFTYRMYVDPETPTAYAESYRQVARATTPDPYTFVVTYEKPYAPALGSWGSLLIHPKHLLEDFKGTELSNSPLVRAPIGTGPYIFKDWVAGEKLVLEVNENYFEGRAYLKRIVYRIIPDQSTQFLELLSGGLDFMSLNPLQYETQTNMPAFKDRYNKYRYLAFGYTYLGYNLKRPLFQDRRVRQALSYAINKQEVVDGVLLGLGQVATGPYKTDTWVYNEKVQKYSYDPDKARQLLSEAGWVDSDGDGIVDKDGKPFAFSIVTNQGNDLRIKTGEIIQRRFKEIGVDVKLRVIEWAAFLKEFIDPGNFDATILGWTGGPEPDQYNIWHSSKIGPRMLNFIGFSNGEADDLLERGRRTFDHAERKQIYDRFQEILAEEQPYTFLYLREALPAVTSRMQGIEPAPAGISYNFIRWYVPEGEQKYDR